jgi:hypothetical protein
MAPAASLPRLALLVQSVAIRPPAQPKISTSFRPVAPFSAAPMPAARTAGVVGESAHRMRKAAARVLRQNGASCVTASIWSRKTKNQGGRHEPIARALTSGHLVRQLHSHDPGYFDLEQKILQPTGAS